MKRKTAILLALLIGLMSTNAAELLKVPQLLRHFAQHTQADPGLTFWTFLADHYSDIPHTDNDDSEDQKLPFKTPVHAAVVVSCWFVPQTGIVLKSPEFVARPVPRYRFSCTPSEFAHHVWQPPQHA